MNDIRRFVNTFSQQTADNSEREAIQYLVKLLRLSREHKSQLEFVQKASYEGKLTVGAWREAFPDFPFLLVVRSSEKLKDLVGWHYFLGSKKGAQVASKIVDMIDAAEYFADNRATVVMVKLPHVADWAIVHNASVSEEHNVALMRLPLADGRRLTIQRLDTFLDAWKTNLREYFQDAMDSSGSD